MVVGPLVFQWVYGLGIYWLLWVAMGAVKISGCRFLHWAVAVGSTGVREWWCWVVRGGCWVDCVVESQAVELNARRYRQIKYPSEGSWFCFDSFHFWDVFIYCIYFGGIWIAVFIVCKCVILLYISNLLCENVVSSTEEKKSSPTLSVDVACFIMLLIILGSGNTSNA